MRRLNSEHKILDNPTISCDSMENNPRSEDSVVSSGEVFLVDHSHQDSLGIHHEGESFPKRRTNFLSLDLDQTHESEFTDAGREMEKSQDEALAIQAEIKAVPLFQGYDEDELRRVTDYMYLRKVRSGEVVINYGSVGDAFYVVRSGRYQCTVPGEGEDGQQQEICSYDGTGHFGELALINRKPRAATITAVTDGELWVLCALRNAWLRKRRAMRNAERLEQALILIPLFRDNLSNRHINQLLDATDVINLAAGETICRQGEPGDAMYIILKGEVEVLINGTRVKSLGPNEFFGERALVLEERRAATCRTAVNSKLAKLPKESFHLLIPDKAVDDMKRNIAASYSRPTARQDASNEGATEEDASEASVCIEYLCQELVRRGSIEKRE